MILIVAACLTGAASGIGALLLLARRRSAVAVRDRTAISVVVVSALTCVALAYVVSNPRLAVVALHLAALAIPLGLIDASTYTLPRAPVYAAYATTALILPTAAMGEHLAERLVTATLAALALTTALYLLALTGGLGLGDVRLAPVLGAHLGWAGWKTLATGVGLAFLLGALLAVLLVALQRIKPADRVPFGPALLAGSILSIVSTQDG